MPLTLDQLAEEAMHLPSTSRAELAERMVESLEFPENDEVQALWTIEVIRRRDEVRSGRVQPICGENVTAEARMMLVLRRVAQVESGELALIPDDEAPERARRNEPLPSGEL